MLVNTYAFANTGEFDTLGLSQSVQVSRGPNQQFTSMVRMTEFQNVQIE